MTAPERPGSMMLVESGLIEELQQQGALSEADAMAASLSVWRGNSPLAALAALPGAATLWQHLARTAGKKFYPSHTELGVVCAHLFDFETALTHSMLPHRKQGADTWVVTFDPQAQDGPRDVTRSLYDEHGTRTRHQERLYVRHALVTPQTWRFLYDLTFPSGLCGFLSYAQALSLATLTPLGAATQPTAEQDAEAIALSRGLPFIDPTRDPPEHSALELLGLDVMREFMILPHHFEGPGSEDLVLLLHNPDDVRAISTAERSSMRRVRPAVSTALMIQAVLGELA